MAERRRAKGHRSPEAPIPLAPIDLLAGLAPGLELQADGDADASDDAVTTTVAETGKLLRADDDTIRRLIRSAAIEPGSARSRKRGGERARAGVVPRTRTRPGE